MKILITGSSGFIGSYLKKYFNDKHEIICTTSKILNIEDTNTVDKFFDNNFFDAILHCAVSGRNQVHSTDQKIFNSNLKMFLNLYKNKNKFKKFINFGSGAEFGLDINIDQYHEDMIFNRYPKESYGCSKNIIARRIRELDNFFNLRIFSCLDKTEGDDRLLKKFKRSTLQGKKFTIENRYVDFISLYDIALVVDAVINEKIVEKDINVVYLEKNMLSDILNKYCDIHNIDKQFIEISNTSDKNYTGSGFKLSNFNIELQGIDVALREYGE